MHKFGSLGDRAEASHLLEEWLAVSSCARRRRPRHTGLWCWAFLGHGTLAMAACSLHDLCQDLAGDCCPTETGLQLSCCGAPAASPPASPPPLTYSVTFAVDAGRILAVPMYVAGTGASMQGPTGFEMATDLVSTEWSVTVPLEAGTHTFQFRVGHTDSWTPFGPEGGWENGTVLAAAGCGVGPYGDRQVVVTDTDVAFALPPDCFSSCAPCSIAGPVGLDSGQNTAPT